MKTAGLSNSSVVVPSRGWQIVVVVALLHLSAVTLFKSGFPELLKPQKSEITVELGGVVLRGDGGEGGGRQASVTSRLPTQKLMPGNEPGQRQLSQPNKVTEPAMASTESAAAAGVQAAPTSNADYKAAYLNNPKPPYPALAFQMRIEGTVRLKALVLSDGSCGEVLLAESSGNDLLDRSAMNTVRQWRFVPAQSQGKDVSQWVSIPIAFTLKRR